MSAELRDLRAKVTVEADCALSAVSQASGKDKAEIVRDVLHAWALQQIDEAMLLQRLLMREGLAREVQGAGGNRA
jgi:hypothetical protein